MDSRPGCDSNVWPVLVAGKSPDMVRKLARTASRLVRPASRPAALVLAWTHRYTVALWCRSIGTEVRHQFDDRRPNLSRSGHLLKSLWRVSSDAKLANAPELRRIAINDGLITIDAVETWKGRYLLDNRLGLNKQGLNKQGLSDRDLSERSVSEVL